MHLTLSDLFVLIKYSMLCFSKSVDSCNKNLQFIVFFRIPLKLSTIYLSKEAISFYRSFLNTFIWVTMVYNGAVGRYFYTLLEIHPFKALVKNKITVVKNSNWNPSCYDIVA